MVISLEECRGSITYGGNSLAVGAENSLEPVGLLPKLGHRPLILCDINMVLVHKILNEDLDQSAIQLGSTGPTIEARRKNVDLGVCLGFALSS